MDDIYDTHTSLSADHHQFAPQNIMHHDTTLTSSFFSQSSSWISPVNWTSNNTNELPPSVIGRMTDDEESFEKFDFVLNQIVFPLLFSLITFIGVIGNCLVIYVIMLREQMRTVTNIMLLNLAVTDLLFVMIIPPLTAYQFANARWPFGDVACKLMNYTVNVMAYISVYTLVLVSVVRFLTIVHGPRTVALRTRRNTTIAIGVIWAVMLAVNIPVMTSYTVITEPKIEENGKVGIGEGPLPDCRTESMMVAQRLFTTFFIFSYLLPLSIIAIFAMGILRYIKKNRSQILSSKTRAASKKKRAGRLVILLVVVFAILWLPIHMHLLVVFYFQIREDLAPWWYQAVMVLWHCLAYFNSCINPIIYNHASRDFRNAFPNVVCVCLGGTGCLSETGIGEGISTPAIILSMMEEERMRGRMLGYGLETPSPVNLVRRFTWSYEIPPLTARENRMVIRGEGLEKLGLEGDDVVHRKTEYSNWKDANEEKIHDGLLNAM